MKPEVTEQAAAAYFVLSKIENMHERWSEITEELKDILAFIVKEKEAAILDFALAAIALDVQTIQTIFKKAQADRIEKQVFKSLNIGKLGGYNINALAVYTAAYKAAEEGEDDPINAVANILIHDLLGPNINEFANEETQIVSPFMVLHFAGMLNTFTGYWERINEDYTLTNVAIETK